MKKIANGDGVIIVSMSTQEFERISGKSHGDVVFGENISLSIIKNKLDLVDNKKAELLELKTLATSIASKITAIGI